MHDQLVPFLDDSDPAVRKSAVHALGKLEYVPAISKLLHLLGDPDHWVRDATVLSLERFSDSVIPLLEQAMVQETAAFKILSIDVLRGVGSDRAREAIGPYLTNPDINVRRAAEKALSQK